jgi:hypothetical protein
MARRHGRVFAWGVPAVRFPPEIPLEWQVKTSHGVVFSGYLVMTANNAAMNQSSILRGFHEQHLKYRVGA